MVEGHQCHRVAHAHRRLLVGRKFEATSPNGRFTEGAAAVNQQTLDKIEVHGKNLFYFFGSSDEPVVVHIHFGMSGAFRTSTVPGPDPTDTTRLRLVNHQMGLVAQLSAMTVQHGSLDLYRDKTSKLGPDPLREDADKELLWERMQKLKKPIGLILMDQSCVAGIGNIYRAEILFKAGVHPEIPCNTVPRSQFDSIWFHSLTLLQRGFRCGSILTVDPEEAKVLGKPWTRRYIYNQKSCGRCGSSIRTWDMAARTVYACPTCQPLRDDSHIPAGRRSALQAATPAQLFNSHCARDDPEDLVPSKMTCSQLRELLLGFNLNPQGKKAVLIQRLEAALQWAGKKEPEGEDGAIISVAEDTQPHQSWRQRWKQSKLQAQTTTTTAEAVGENGTLSSQRPIRGRRASRRGEVMEVDEKETLHAVGGAPGVELKEDNVAIMAEGAVGFPALAAEDDADSDCGLLGIPKHMVNEIMQGGALPQGNVLQGSQLSQEVPSTADSPIAPATATTSGPPGVNGPMTHPAPSKARTARRTGQLGKSASSKATADAKAEKASERSARGRAGSQAKLQQQSAAVVDAASMEEDAGIYDVQPGTQGLEMASAKAAALEKVLAGESRAVEHVALHDDDTDALLAAVANASQTPQKRPLHAAAADESHDQSGQQVESSRGKTRAGSRKRSRLTSSADAPAQGVP